MRIVCNLHLALLPRTERRVIRSQYICLTGVVSAISITISLSGRWCNRTTRCGSFDKQTIRSILSTLSVETSKWTNKNVSINSMRIPRQFSGWNYTHLALVFLISSPGWETNIRQDQMGIIRSLEFTWRWVRVISLQNFVYSSRFFWSWSGDMKPKPVICAYQAAKMFTNYWLDYTKTETVTIKRPWIFAIENDRQRLFSPIYDF